MLDRLFKRSEAVQKNQLVQAKQVDETGLENWNVLINQLTNAKSDKLIANTTNAMRFATVYSCINVLSDDISKLPLKTYVKDDKGEIAYDTDSDVHYVVSISPNRYMTPVVYFKLVMVDVNVYGNHYSYIEFDKGRVNQIIPLRADRTQLWWDKEHKNLIYETEINGEKRFLYDYEVLHFKGLTKDGINGISPISACLLQLESMDSALRVNKELIDGGNTPVGILTAPSKIKPENRDIVREEWKRVNSGSNIAIMDMGWEYKNIGISPADMQHLESLRFNQQQIASIFKVPLHKINDLTHATYTNIENQSLDYVKNTLQPIVTMIEQEIQIKLYSTTQRKAGYYCKFNMDSELRGSAVERAKVQEMYIRNGVKTLNEIRGQNEDSPYQGDFANKPWMSLNNVPAENSEEYQKNKFGLSLQGDKDKEKET